MKDILTYSIIGAGNGGLAMAGYIASKGYRVNLYNRTREKIETLIDNPVIYLQGEVEAEGRLNFATDDIEKAVTGADIIMVTIPASGHSNIAKEMAPYLKDGQIVILNPGRTGGALEVYETLLKERKRNNIIVAEAQTFIYAARATSDNEVFIYQTKNEVSMAAIPATQTDYVVELLNHIYPEFISAKDVLETSINNYGAIFHPGPTILNSGFIERGIAFEYYKDGISPSIGNFLEQMDLERMEIGRALGVNAVTTLEWLEESYDAFGDTIYEAVQNNKAYENIEAPKGLNIRYIFEDVPFSLVPLESFGKLLGVETPAITSLINMAEIMMNQDFRSKGRTAEKLGLEGLNIQDMHLLAREGKISKKRLEEVI